MLLSSSRPKSGSMLLYSRKKVRYRRDGYCWKKRKDGKTTREDHMKLKVQGTEVRLNFFLFSNLKKITDTKENDAIHRFPTVSLEKLHRLLRPSTR